MLYLLRVSTVSVSVIVALVLFGRRTRRISPGGRTGALVLFAVAFGTPLLVYARSFFSHAWSAALLYIAFELLDEVRGSPGASRARGPARGLGRDLGVSGVRPRRGSLRRGGEEKPEARRRFRSRRLATRRSPRHLQRFLLRQTLETFVRLRVVPRAHNSFARIFRISRPEPRHRLSIPFLREPRNRVRGSDPAAAAGRADASRGTLSRGRGLSRRFGSLLRRHVRIRKLAWRVGPRFAVSRSGDSSRLLAPRGARRASRSWAARHLDVACRRRRGLFRAVFPFFRGDVLVPSPGTRRGIPLLFGVLALPWMVCSLAPGLGARDPGVRRGGDARSRGCRPVAGLSRRRESRARPFRGGASLRGPLRRPIRPRAVFRSASCGRVFSRALPRSIRTGWSFAISPRRRGRRTRPASSGSRSIALRGPDRARRHRNSKIFHRARNRPKRRMPVRDAYTSRKWARGSAPAPSSS